MAMSNVVRFKRGNRSDGVLLDEACLWVVKLSGSLSEAELQALHAWLDTSPEHVKALLAAAQAWGHASVLSELADVFPLAEYRPPRRPAPKSRPLVALFASAALLLLCFTPVLRQFVPFWPPAPAPLQLGYETRIGQQSTVLLPDGSVVVLNTNSRIEMDFSGRWRDIHLRRGEAHFTVAKDKSRPFRVHANGGVVEAVGTAFTVQESAQDGLEVTVVEGVVNFTPVPAPESPAPQARQRVRDEAPPGTTPMALTAGESVQIKQEDEAIVKQKFRPEELETKLAWRDGMLLFEGDPLEKVVHEVSRYTSIRIDVDDAVRNIEVLGYFRTGDIEGVLLTMRDTFHVKVERLSEDHIVLKAEN
jgi:transmembrane sensor